MEPDSAKAMSPEEGGGRPVPGLGRLDAPEEGPVGRRRPQAGASDRGVCQRVKRAEEGPRWGCCTEDAEGEL